MEIKSKMKWFNRLRRRAFNDIQRSGTTANDFRVFVLDPSLPWEDEDRRAIIRADQVATICAVISHSKYLNWYHSDLLEDIVKEYGSNTLQGDMEEYCAEKSEMDQRFSLENVKNVVLCPACSHDVTIQAFVPQNCKMSDMRRVCNGYSRRNGIPEMLCRVHTAASNSPLAIMLLLPYDAALKVRPPLPLPWSIDVLPEKIEDRCICILSEEETLQLIEVSGSHSWLPALHSWNSSLLDKKEYTNTPIASFAILHSYSMNLVLLHSTGVTCATSGSHSATYFTFLISLHTSPSTCQVSCTHNQQES